MVTAPPDGHAAGAQSVGAGIEALDPVQAKEVKSITLPQESGIRILALELAD
jgi:hypothetical protein